MISLILLSVGCSTPLPDADPCLTKSDLSARCVNTLNPDQVRNIPKSVWWTPEMHVGRVSMAIEEFAEYQTFVEEVCLKITCTKKQRKMLEKGKKVLDVLFIEYKEMVQP